MVDKIISALNLKGMDPVNFTSYLSNIKTYMMAKSHREQLRFTFNLFDHDSNGFICPNDIDVFNTQFTGTNSLLSSDFLALAKMFSFK